MLVGNEVDNTVAGQKERRRVQANERRRDEQCVGETSQAPSAGGGALAKTDQRKSTHDDDLKHKVYKKGRLPVLAKTWLENPGEFTDPFDAFVGVITKQHSVKYYIHGCHRHREKGREIWHCSRCHQFKVALDVEEVPGGTYMYKVKKQDIWPPMQSTTRIAT